MRQSNSLFYTFESLMAASTTAELHTAALKIANNLGFSSFHYGAHVAIKKDGNAARFVFDGTEQVSLHVLSSYPLPWFERYQAMGYIEVDPLVRHCAESIIPMPWRKRGVDAPKVRALFNEAADHGLVDGITCPIHAGAVEHAIFSLATDSPDTARDKHMDRLASDGMMLSFHVHEAMRRLVFADKGLDVAPEMTVREVEALQWSSQGKTAWEISQILGISERTAVFHLTNATRKLQATNRRQAVTRAIALGIIGC